MISQKQVQALCELSKKRRCLSDLEMGIYCCKEKKYFQGYLFFQKALNHQLNDFDQHNAFIYFKNDPVFEVFYPLMFKDSLQISIQVTYLILLYQKMFFVKKEKYYWLTLVRGEFSCQKRYQSIIKN